MNDMSSGVNPTELLCTSVAGCKRHLANASAQVRAAVVAELASLLRRDQAAILSANALDLEAAAQSGLSASLTDRLMLNPARLQAMAADLERVAQLEDPIGLELERRALGPGMMLSRRRVPIGTLGVIYEARPNVTTDIAALAIKSGNALVLRGGRETAHSNRALLACVHAALDSQGLPTTLVQALPAEQRSEVGELLAQDRHIDLLIPRGGQALQDYCREHARMAVVYGGIGICHLYWAPSADLNRALPVVVNAKVQRPSVCNALDTLLIHADAAEKVLPALVAEMIPLGVRFVADERALPLLAEQFAAQVRAAEAGDFDREWLSLVLGLKVVDSLDQAIEHIALHSTDHSDGILTEDAEEAARFLNEVDSAAVYWNASTRFTDGSAFGLGAEVAVSTQRLHARGPMALEALTTYKWVVEGNYSVRKG
ncbi:MAG: glutamate-5-semialdehyde dehydrogenase [Xanthomonadales bacterium]|nr:glutamate-5-semialdehyde dehydrogenase [Xanthomonadales bacterium]